MRHHSGLALRDFSFTLAVVSDRTRASTMSERFRRAFFAYPGSPSDLATPIATAAEYINASSGKINIKTWPQMEVFGNDIAAEMRNEVKESQVLVCDITRNNLNVYYEIGLAIGLGKSIAPVVNISFANATDNAKKDGLFDNIGYQTYENWEQLCEILRNLPTSDLVELYGKPLNSQQSLFVLDTFRKTDFRNSIVSAVKDSKVFFRNFDPVENPRFSTVSIIGEVTSSSGIIVPLLADHVDDAMRHNLRAAFLAGLGHGLNRKTLMLQREVQNQVNPTDYREFVQTIRNEGEVSDLVVGFSRDALIATQSIEAETTISEKSELQKLSLGASAAENEFRTLEGYFVETAEFVRTLRGEVRIVAGRKGSGKTAIFFRVRDSFRVRNDAFVTDLKPESHQLSLFREELLKIVGAGVFDHTLAAFWYFLFLSEMLLTVKRRYEYLSSRDSGYLEKISDIEDFLLRYKINQSGDFTSRINRLGSFVLQEIEQTAKRGGALTPEALTNIVFREGIGKIRDEVKSYLNYVDTFVILFDNLDKGWPAAGVDEFDVRLVRLCVEALDKIRRDFGSLVPNFFFVVFLRNDIYELLVDETPDRGKAAEVRIDWTDRAKLRQVILKRLQASLSNTDSKFEEIWARFFVKKVGSRDSFEYFIDHCLMRPRFLINIIENAIANAINRGHNKVSQEDCKDAVRQHSNYLVSDFGYEIRDVSGLSADILYAFVGVTQLLTREEIFSQFHEFGLPIEERENALWLLLWYGVLGVGARDGGEKFIYDYQYNMKRLEAEIRNLEDEIFVVNAALHVALTD